MQFSEMIEGLQIFAKYEEQGLDTHLAGAEHDVVFAVTCDPQELDRPDEYGLQTWGDPRVSEEDVRRLDQLGWYISEDDVWVHQA